MTPPSSGRPTSLIAGAILALAMLGFASPSKARADCGHYAHAKLSQEVGSALATLDILSTDSNSRNATPLVPLRQPCSGPSCSEGPSRPTAPPPVGPQTVEKWLCPSCFADLAGLDGRRWYAHEPSPQPVGRTVTLERPPRSLPA